MYMYLRSKNSKYGNAGTPYYVGKGKGLRAYSKSHRVQPPEDKSRIVFAVRSVSEEFAHLEEKRLIAVYGRIDNRTGCLRNLTDGGEGQCGVRLSQDQKDFLSRFWKGKKKGPRVPMTEEQRIAHSERMKRSYASGKHAKPGPKPTPRPPKRPICGWKISEETRAKMSASAKAIPHLPERIAAWKQSAYAKRGG